MKLLCLHASRFAYNLDHPTAGADRHEPGEVAEFGDALVVFVSVEPGDVDKAVAAASEVRHAARRSGAERIVVNPFVHLTSEPAPPEEAHEVSSRLAERLRETFEGEVVYTSFGWYKAFQLDVRGDDHSQMFRHL
jgi:threonyl-tRNA synthetase